MINRRKFTEEQKKAILDQAGQIGINAALREHSLSYSVFSRWRQQLMPNGSVVHTVSAAKLKLEITQLNEENDRLKKIIEELAQQMERKDEELKKLAALSYKQ